MNATCVWIRAGHPEIGFMHSGAVETRIERLYFLFGVRERDVAFFCSLVFPLPLLELGAKALVLALLCLQLVEARLPA